LPDDGGYGTVPSGASSDEQRNRWTNANVFAALYIRDLEHETPPGTYELVRSHAQGSIAGPLELSIDTQDHVRRTDMDMPAAAMWILIAGRIVYRYCKNNVDKVHPPGALRGTNGSIYLWLGGDGFSLARWKFWKERFGEIAQLEAVETGARTLASQATNEMGKIESEDV